MRRLIALPLLLLGLGCVRKSNSGLPVVGSVGGTNYTAPDSREVYLLMGQSNMNGYIGDPYPTDPNITEINFSYPEHGPGYVFGLNEAKTKQIVLVQCAVNGTRLETWLPGAGNYTMCMNILAANGITKLTGIVFYQGESDSENIGYAWAQNFTSLIRNLRGKFGDMPVVYTQIGQCNDPGQTANLINFQAEQASVVLPNVSMITTDDVPPVDGGWHHGHDGNIIIGNRFYDAMQLLKK